jgi:hypothetical protein
MHDAEIAKAHWQITPSNTGTVSVQHGIHE